MTTAKPISMNIYIYIHAYAFFENGFVVRSARKWKGNFDAVRRIKSVCTENRRNEEEGGCILRLKGCSREEGEGYYSGSSADNYDEPPLDGRRMRIK